MNDLVSKGIIANCLNQMPDVPEKDRVVANREMMLALADSGILTKERSDEIRKAWLTRQTE